MCEEANRLQIKQHLIAQFGLPEDQIEPLLTPFIQAVAEYQHLLESAIEEGEHGAIGRAAHKYKGALQNLGMKQTATLALEIEHAAKEEQSSFAFQAASNKIAKMIAPLLG